MGIRFRCPNGHKLNVKVFLAGKRGICPNCGVKLRIPEESDPVLLREKQARRRLRAAARGNSTAVAALPSSPATGSIELPRVAPPTSDASSPAAAPSPLPPGSSAPTAESAEGLWYVRLASGGQFGPASKEVFDSWVAEGRVTVDAMVWREGWAKWRPATPFLPAGTADVATTEATPLNVNPTPDPVPTPPEIVDGAPGGSVTELYRRRKSTKMALMMVVLLGLACAVLAATLVYVLRFR